MADTINLSAVLDKSTYNTGDAMSLTLSGSASQGGTTTTAVVAPTIKLSDGTTKSLNAVTATVNSPLVPLTYQITSISDQAGRAWVISADGQSATATA